MFHALPPQKARLVSFLKRVAPFSVIERGIHLASSGSLVDCESSGNVISAFFSHEEDGPYSTKLTVVSSAEIEAECSCCSLEDMREQWCSHAVALLWKASDLELFEPRAGLAHRESTFHTDSNSPVEIAKALREVCSLEPERVQGAQSEGAVSALGYTPHVSLQLELNSDRLGISVLFDEIEQEPAIFEGFRQISSRALDNILLQILDDEGSWDENNRRWYINSSRGIDLVLGLINEYESVVSQTTGRSVTVKREMVSAKLILSWQANSLELSMEWIITEQGAQRRVQRNQAVFGTGPYWVAIRESIYRLSPQAARISSMFPSGQTISVPRSQVSPILEALHELQGAFPSALEIVNAERQPHVEIRPPQPILHLDRRDVSSDHFTSSRVIEVGATLDFEYPTPPPQANVVYLRDRAREESATQQLLSLGFVASRESNRFYVSGDEALDFISSAAASLGETFSLVGLEEVRKGIRFTDLTLSVSLKAASGDEKPKPSEKTSRRASSRSKEDPNFSGAIDWFECHIAATQNNANVALSSVFKHVRNDTDRWVRLDSGAYAPVPGGSIAQLKTILGMVEPQYRVSNAIRAQLSLAQAISMSRVGGGGFTLSLDRNLERINEKFSSFSQIKAIKASKNFNGKLRHYQEEGISWLNFLCEFELGGILADEMGLGKTVQTLAFFQALREKRRAKNERPILIVAPTSVITNWGYEIKRFTPEMRVLMLHGSGRKALFDSIPDVDFVLTSYALLRLDRYELERFEFSFIVLDEAQNIKNPLAAVTKAAKSLRSTHRLALTGTPTENRPMELWSIMDFLNPGYLGSYEFFRTSIERPILEGGPSAQVATTLNAKTRPFILRRLKAEVEKELPPKIESELHVEMTASQRQLYSEILEEVRPKVFEAVKKRGVAGASVSILAALLRLRQVCNHPNSIESIGDVPGYDSGKFNLLKDITVEALESGRKILLFSQFRGMLAIIRSWLQEIGVNHLYLDGTTRNRQELIDTFSTDESVRLFLISLKAGGAGLNLMAADTVIIYDPWWNPAVESQAVDRAHRIGQNKTVNVYRLVTEESVEQKIMELKARKSKIVDALINENGLSTINLSKKDLESLFSPLSPSEG